MPSFPTAFDAFEIHGMQRTDSGGLEPVDSEAATKWSLFGHVPGEGLFGIGDFDSRAQAEDICTRLLSHTAGSIQIDEIRKHCAEYRCIALIWMAADVQTIRPDLTEGQAWKVLQACERHHDCKYGVTWSGIKVLASKMFPESVADPEKMAVLVDRICTPEL